MTCLLFLLALLLFFVEIAAGSVWNSSLLSIDPLKFRDTNGTTTLRDLEERLMVSVQEWGCLTQTDRPHHALNKAVGFELNGTIENTRHIAQLDHCFIRGTTIWINEHMAVGHIYYDSWMIQALASTKVDRIVLQRAPCMNVDLCSGIGTWESFFKGFYASMISAFAPGIPIFTRFQWQERVVKPSYLSVNASHCELPFPSNFKQLQPCYEQEIPLASMKCFERVIKRKCNHCFHSSIQPDTAARFKSSAYDLIAYQKNIAKPPLHFEAKQPVTVTLALRSGSASRRIENAMFFADALRQALPQPQFDFQFIFSTNSTRPYVDQMQIAAATHVMISEHGAYQSNLVYMRNASLWIELRGMYKNGENANFEQLARMFGVYYRHVNTSELTSHRQETFNVTSLEIVQVAALVVEYALMKPYAFNII